LRSCNAPLILIQLSIILLLHQSELFCPSCVYGIVISTFCHRILFTGSRGRPDRISWCKRCTFCKHVVEYTLFGVWSRPFALRSELLLDISIHWQQREACTKKALRVHRLATLLICLTKIPLTGVSDSNGTPLQFVASLYSPSASAVDEIVSSFSIIDVPDLVNQ